MSACMQGETLPREDAHRAQARRVEVRTGGDQCVLGLRLDAPARDGACNREYLGRGGNQMAIRWQSDGNQMAHAIESSLGGEH